VFADLLGAERVGANDDFFALGGNSLLATQAVARIGAALDARVLVRTLFEASTVAGLAAKVEQNVGAGGRPALVARPRAERIPLSLGQLRMWFLNQFDTASAAYNIPVAIRLSGELDIDALRLAVGDMVARHEVLRTIYPQTPDGPVQQVLAPHEVRVDLAPLVIAEDAARRSPFAPRCSSSPTASTSWYSWPITSAPTAGRWVRWCATRCSPTPPAWTVSCPHGCRCRCSTRTTASGSTSCSARNPMRKA
jgi:hypothetical protein